MLLPTRSPAAALASGVCCVESFPVSGREVEGMVLMFLKKKDTPTARGMSRPEHIAPPEIVSRIPTALQWDLLIFSHAVL